LVSGIMVSNAQIFQFGLKGALNYSQLRSDDNRWLSSSNKTGYQAGVWARVGGLIHVQPEVYFTGKSSEANFDFNNSDVKADVTFTSVDVPVLLGTRVGLGPVGLRFQAGPLFSFVVDKNVGDALSQVIDINGYKENTTSIVGGVGLDVGKFRADLRYEHGMTSLSKEGFEDQKFRGWSLGVGLRLF
jgi:hypothetical protein